MDVKILKVSFIDQFCIVDCCYCSCQLWWGGQERLVLHRAQHCLWMLHSQWCMVCKQWQCDHGLLLLGCWASTWHIAQVLHGIFECHVCWLVCPGEVCSPVVWWLLSVHIGRTACLFVLVFIRGLKVNVLFWVACRLFCWTCCVCRSW